MGVALPPIPIVRGGLLEQNNSNGQFSSQKWEPVVLAVLYDLPLLHLVLLPLIEMSELSESETQVDVGDNVFPVHMLDDAKGVREMCIVWMFRFNDALDAEMLHSSLTRLISIGDWKKLGGRLRLKESGQLEIFVPDEFTPEHPAVGYTNDVFEMLIDEHSLACQLPRPTDKLSIQPSPSHFAELCGLSHMPQTLEDHLNNDIPQIHLHVTNFIDETLVTINFCHVTLDAPSQTALLQNWSHILSGQEAKVMPLLGARDDILWEAGARDDASRKEVYMQRQRRLKGAKLVKFLSRMLWSSYRSPEKEAHMLCVPHHTFQNLRLRAQMDVTDEGKGVFVGETDTLAAWAAHLVATSEPKKRPITLVNAMNARYRLSNLGDGSHVYAQNMMMPISFTSLRTEEALGPIGRIARINRQHLIEQATDEQMRSFLRLARKNQESGKGFMPLFGRSNAMPVFMNNLTKLGVLNSVDFSAAVTKERTSPSKTNAKGTPIYHHFQTIHAPSRVDLKIPEFVVFGKDHEHNYWIRATAKPQVWEKIQEEMGQLDLQT